MEQKDLDKLITEQKTAFEELKATLVTQAAEVKKFGEADALTRAKIEKLAEAIADIETKLNRPNVTIKVEDKSAEKAAPEVRAYEKYVRYGLKGNAAVDRMDAEEKTAWTAIQTKSLYESADGQGGFSVPEDVRTEIIKRIPNFANVGGLVTRQATSRDVLRFPRIVGSPDDIHTSGIAVTWEDETVAYTETDFSLGSIGIPIKKARLLIRVANDLLEDSAVDVVSLLQNLSAEAFGLDEDLQLTLGAGPKKPEGFMINADIAAIVSGNATAVTYNGLVNLCYGLPGQYTANARFMLKRATLGAFLQITDSQNRPLWQPGIGLGHPATMLGYPIVMNENMPAIAAGAQPIIFGDFKRLMVVADRAALSVKRLDEKFADTDETGFIVRRRMGARVVAPWAAKRHTIST